MNEICPVTSSLLISLIRPLRIMAIALYSLSVRRALWKEPNPKLD